MMPSQCNIKALLVLFRILLPEFCSTLIFQSNSTLYQNLPLIFRANVIFLSFDQTKK